MSEHGTIDTSDRGIQGRAHSRVAQAVSGGDLPRPNLLRCVDCGVPASEYDHYLGYQYALIVQPVCHPCNMRRFSLQTQQRRARAVVVTPESAVRPRRSIRGPQTRPALPVVEEGHELLLFVHEVAQQLKVDSETVRRWLRAGTLRGVMLSRRGGWRIEARELARFLQARRP